MSKKTKIILILIFIIIVAIAGFFFYKSKKGEPITNPITDQPFINPFGEDNNQENQTEEEKIEWERENSQENSKFYKLTDFAIAGGDYFEESKIITDIDGTEQTKYFPILKYIERATGHIYQMDLETKEVNKISNSTIPSVYEAFINKLADTFIYRYIGTDGNTITSFIAKLGDIKGEFLPSNIINMSLSPDKNKAFYLVKNTNGVVGFILSLEDNKKTQIFTSSFSEWSSEWINDQKIYLTTKPSWSVPGSLFSLDIKSGTLSKIFGKVEGLTTLSNSDGSFVLYGASLETGPKLWLLDTEEHTTKDLNTYGLPEKCVWSSNDIYVYCAVPNTVTGKQYPDSWYQGLVSFDDFFVKINTETGERVTLSNSKNEIPVDAINLFLNKEENILFFTNKKDSTLWSLEL